MGIKTLVKDNDQHTVYPCLKETIDGDVFLCTTEDKATCLVVSISHNYTVGTLLYGSHIPILYSFNGTVTLSNE